MTAVELPRALTEIRDDFLALDVPDRLQLLLEFSQQLPPLPARYEDDPALLERVLECQAPVFVVADIEDGLVHLYATAPREAPTTRGFASILVQGLDCLTPQQLLAVPDDYPQMLGLGIAVSPLRLRGMTGILARAKRQITQKMAA